MNNETLGNKFKKYPRGTFDRVFVGIFDLIYKDQQERANIRNMTENQLLNSIGLSGTITSRLLLAALQGLNEGYSPIHCMHLVRTEFMRILKFESNITDKILEEMCVMLILSEFYLNIWFGKNHKNEYFNDFYIFVNQMCSQEANAKIEEIVDFMKGKCVFFDET